MLGDGVEIITSFESVGKQATLTQTPNQRIVITRTPTYATPTIWMLPYKAMKSMFKLPYLHSTNIYMKGR